MYITAEQWEITDNKEPNMSLTMQLSFKEAVLLRKTVYTTLKMVHGSDRETLYELYSVLKKATRRDTK